MKSALWVITILYSWLGPFNTFSQPTGHVVRAVSENGRFSVEVIENTTETRQISVFRNADARPFLWGREVKWPTHKALSLVPPLKVLIDNSGEHLVLWDNLWNSDDCWLFLKQGGSELRVPGGQAVGRKGGALEDRIVGSVDFILDPVGYCFWLAIPGQWFVFDLKNFRRVTVDAALAKELDEICRRRALEKVAEHRRGRSFLDGVRARASRVIPKVAPPPKIDPFEAAQAGYCTIAQYRWAEDRHLLEELLQMRNQLETYSQVSDGVIKLHWRSREASLGERLLAHWDNKTVKVPIGYGPEFARRDATFGDLVPRASLAEVRGSVQLPFSFPNRAGEVSIYIIPNELKKSGWFQHKDVVATRTRVSDEFANGAKSEPRVVFKIRTLSPGEYRCKAVWDRRPPSPPQNEIWVEPSPGDYESVESEPFELTAGQILTNVVLYCTNRVGNAAEYFAADDLWSISEQRLSAELKAESSENSSENFSE